MLVFRNTGKMNSDKQKGTPLYVHLTVFGVPFFFSGCCLLGYLIDSNDENLFFAQMVVYTAIFAVLYGMILGVRRPFARRSFEKRQDHPEH